MSADNLRTCSACQNDLVCHDQGKCLRPTPETDDFILCYVRTDHNWRAFARRLERERDEARETLDLMCDEFQRIKAAPGCTSGIAWFCERAVSGIKQRVPLIVQRDKAEKERDEARAELAAMREAVAVTAALAEWSARYPRGVIYSASNRQMDAELIELEERAKAATAKLQPFIGAAPAPATEGGEA